MVKSELILSLGYKLDHLSPADIEFAVNFILEEMAKVLADGGRIEVRGFGTFSVSERTLLTDDNALSKRFWNVPDWLNPAKGGCIPSYHDEKSYIDGLLKTAGRGQEFVCNPRQNKKFKEWLLNLFSDEINKLNHT